MKKPAVLLLRKEYEDNFLLKEYEALSFVVENDFNSIFIECFNIYDSIKMEEELKEKLRLSHVIAIIVSFPQAPPHKKVMFVRQIISTIRKNAQKDIPIFCFHLNEQILKKFSNENLTSYSLFTQTMKGLMDNFYLNNNFFGADNIEIQDFLKNQLTENYKKEVNEREYGDLGSSDENQQIVVEAMRLRLLGEPTTVKKQFDNQLVKKIPNFNSFEPGFYSRAVKKFKNLKKFQKRKFYIELFESQGYRPAEDSSGFCRIGIGSGRNNYAFAIDTETLLFEISGGFANHALAKMNLENKIQSIESIRKGRFVDEEDRTVLQDRIITGIIVPSINSFDLIPFIQIHQAEFLPKKVFNFLIAQRAFILVDSSGNLI